MPAPSSLPDGQPLLIAAVSGRALAAAARRAGFVPHVCDCYGDCDLEDTAQSWRLWSPGALKPALDSLDRRQSMTVLYGAGFDGRVAQLEASAGARSLQGNAAASADAIRSPVTFFTALRRLGIPFPPIRWTAPPPADDRHWLRKDSWSSGGLADAGGRGESRRRWYWQKRCAGEALSLTFLAGGGEVEAAGWASLWTSPTKRAPMRMGGALAKRPAKRRRAALLAYARALSREFALTGLNSLDAIAAEGDPLLLEVNPRPGMTIELYDDGRTAPLLALHAKARPDKPPPALPAPPQGRALAIVYAERPLLMRRWRWPWWSSDRPRAGALLEEGEPLCTVHASGNEPLKLLRHRLDSLSKSLHATGAMGVIQ